MGYVTYDYYKSIYGEDSMPETDFNRLSWEACRRVDTLTTGKLKFAYPTDEDSLEAVKRCVCKLIEFAGQFEGLADKTAQERLYRDTVREYLSFVPDSNGVNLLYAGIPYPRRNAPISRPPEDKPVEPEES